MEAYKSLYILSCHRARIPKSCCDNIFGKIFLNGCTAFLVILLLLIPIFAMGPVFGISSNTGNTFDFNCTVTSSKVVSQNQIYHVSLGINATKEGKTITGSHSVCKRHKTEQEAVFCGQKYLPSFACAASVDFDGEGRFQPMIDASQDDFKWITFLVMGVVIVVEFSFLGGIFAIIYFYIKSKVTEEETGFHPKSSEYTLLIDNSVCDNYGFNSVIKQEAFLEWMNQTSSEKFETIQMIVPVPRSISSLILTIILCLMGSIMIAYGLGIFVFMNVMWFLTKFISLPMFVFNISVIVFYCLVVLLFIIASVAKRQYWILSDSRVMSYTDSLFHHNVSFFELKQISGVDKADGMCGWGKRLYINYKFTPSSKQAICAGVSETDIEEVYKFIDYRISGGKFQDIQ